MMSAILPLSDGSRARVLSAGDGPPVLLIHGVGLRAEVWGPQIDALCATHRVLAVDMPGHGGSDPLPLGASLPDFVAWAARVIDDLALGPIAVAGHSMGALIAGGLATTYIALGMVGNGDAWEGLNLLRKEVPGHFSMILSKGEMMIPDGKGGTRDAYLDLPGLSVLVGGMWITNLSYWGFNQYITQRALAAKSLDEAQKGMIFAGFLKLLMPLIVVIPGIAALVIVNKGMDASFIESMKDPVTGIIKSDRAYPTLLQVLPAGLKGLAFAALTAAIVSSLASMANSTSTIFTMDIYSKYFGKDASEAKQVKVGRITAVVAFVIAAIVAPALGQLDQAFQFIQEYTGFISPGVFAIFFFGVFWKKTTSNAALVGASLSIPLSVVLKVVFPALPFIDRMGLVFLILAALMIIISLVEGKGKDHPNSIEVNADLFRTSTGFKIGAIMISGIIAALYTIFW